MNRFLLLFVLAILPLSVISQNTNLDIPSVPVKLATLDSVNLDLWNYNQRKVARMPEPVVMYETGDSIYYSMDLGENWISFKGKEATFAGGSGDLYIVFKDELIMGYDIKENDTIYEIYDDILIHEVGQQGSTSMWRYWPDTSLQYYSTPLADVDHFGNWHILYGILDSTETGKPFIKSLNLSSFLSQDIFGKGPIYEMNDSTNKDTVVNYAIATNLVDFAYDHYLAIAYQLSNDSIYVEYYYQGYDPYTESGWKHGSTFAGQEPSISIGCGNYSTGIQEEAVFPVIQYLDGDRNLHFHYFGDYGWKKTTMKASSPDIEQYGPIEYACIDDVVGPLGHSYIFQKEGTLYHAYSNASKNNGIRDTVAHHVAAGSIAYKEFNLDKVDIVWLEEVDGKYELYYQWFEKFPKINNYTSDQQGDELFTAYPNPFSSRITLRIHQDISRVIIFTVEGRILRSFNNIGCSGVCEFTWDGTAENGEQVEEGMYIVQFFNDKNVYTRKIILMK